MLYITHDLATARHFSDEILVLYRGRDRRARAGRRVILDPHHDYTKLLASSAPDPERLERVTAAVTVDRDAIDNSVCYDHRTSRWEQAGVPSATAPDLPVG